MRAYTAEPANHAHFPALDGLRAVAFLMVFGQHYLQLPWGWTGVDVFFVLSGFLITGILFDTSGQAHRIRNFYVRRTLRIFPLYYGPMLLLVLFYPFFRWQWNWAWLLWPTYLGNFIRGYHTFASRSSLQLLADAQLLSLTFPKIRLFFGHFWSLCVEEQFYLVWPWIVFWLRDRRKLLYVCLIFVAGCPLLRVLASHMLPQFMLDQEVLYRYTPFRIDALLLGGCIALARRGPSPRSLMIVARVGFVVLSVALLSWLVSNPTARHHISGGYVYPVWCFTWGLSFIDAYAACILVMALEPGSIAFRVLNLSSLRWLGRISYGTYVFHDIFHVGFNRIVAHFTQYPKLPTAILGLAFTLLAAWASFRYFETPFIRLKERWTIPPPDNETEIRNAAQEQATSNAIG